MIPVQPYASSSPNTTSSIMVKPRPPCVGACRGGVWMVIVKVHVRIGVYGGRGDGGGNKGEEIDVSKKLWY